MKFPPPPKDTFATLYVEDTDRPLPSRVDANTRYAYFKTIARGGKSIIQSCKDLRLGRFVCYKTLRPSVADDPIDQQRFLREARVTAMLQHPNTVPVYDLGRDNHGRAYFTMKLVHGYTFREILNYRDRYDLNQLASVLLQVAHALSFAHTYGVAHRDVKPENILVGPFGEVLLLDWGLAKVWDKEGAAREPPAESGSILEPDSLLMTDRGKLQGTVAYMSPEQIRRDATLDTRTDIFSFGTVLYEVLAGTLPAPGDTTDEVMRAVLSQRPEPPSRVAKYHVPARLEDICLRCIEKTVGQRLPSADQLVRELSDEWRDPPPQARIRWRRGEEEGERGGTPSGSGAPG